MLVGLLLCDCDRFLPTSSHDKAVGDVSVSMGLCKVSCVRELHVKGDSKTVARERSQCYIVTLLASHDHLW